MCVCMHVHACKREGPALKQGPVRSSWDLYHAKEFELFSDISGEPLKTLIKK